MKRCAFILLSLVMLTESVSAQALQLFSPETRQIMNKSQQVVMNFLERYFQTLSVQSQKAIMRKMTDDKVYFRKGSIADLYRVCDTIPFVIDLHDRYYEVKWMKAGTPFIDLVFPAQYDLLLGVNQEEAQHQLKEVVNSAPHDAMESKKKAAFQSSPLLLIPKEKLYKVESDTFQLASLSDATYYYNKVKPVFDSKHPEFAAANLFAGLIDNVDYRMYVEQSVYGLKTINYSITLRQWLNYCSEWGMKVYFAVEEQREDGMLAIVIVRNKELGFNHMLSVVIPDKFISDKSAVLKVRMTPYIPTHNLKNLYQQEPKNRKKIKWQ